MEKNLEDTFDGNCYRLVVACESQVKRIENGRVLVRKVLDTYSVLKCLLDFQ